MRVYCGSDLAAPAVVAHWTECGRVNCSIVELAAVVEPHPACAEARRVNRAELRRSLGHDLPEARGPPANVAREPPKVIDSVMHPLVEVHALVCRAQLLLQPR